MARRTFDVVDIIEILVHWHAGRNNTEIAASLNVDRKTDCPICGDTTKHRQPQPQKGTTTNGKLRDHLGHSPHR
jgi:hypothetical protein